MCQIICSYLHLLPIQIWLTSQSESKEHPCLQIPSTQTSPVKQLLAVKQTFSHLLLEHLSPSAQSIPLKHTTLHILPLHSWPNPHWKLLWHILFDRTQDSSGTGFGWNPLLQVQITLWSITLHFEFIPHTLSRLHGSKIL